MLMKKRIKAKFKGEDFSDVIKDTIKNQCRVTLDLIDNKSESDPHFVVHEIRKTFKNIRAELRLVRSRISFYHAENRFFRDQARLISQVRDIEASLEALALIQKVSQDKTHQQVIESIEESLKGQRSSFEDNELQVTLKKIQSNLLKKYAQIDSWKVEVTGYPDIEPNLKRTYNRGRKSLLRLNQEITSEAFHEWRKRIKYLRYQLDFLSPIWPGFLAAMESELHKLSDLAGLQRDMHNLSNFIEALANRFKKQENGQLLLKTIGQHRNQYQQQALFLGKRLYHLRKKEFTGLLAVSWDAYQTESSTAPGSP